MTTMIPGQFDDVENDESAVAALVPPSSSHDNLQVHPTERKNKTKDNSSPLSTPVTSSSQEQLVADAIQTALLTKPGSQFENATEITDDDEDGSLDDDFDDNEDDFYFNFDEDDAPVVNSSSSSLSVAAASNSNSNKHMNLSHSVKNAVTKMQHLESTKRILTTDRNDRATTEQCLDPRTRLILFKLISRGFLEQIDGCLSTGKEANVYYAKAGKAADASTTATAEAARIADYAIKIYKTSILVFKDRDKYVSGEHRWRKGYCK